MRIEKNIPIPPQVRKTAVDMSIWAKMQVGDSIFFPLPKGREKSAEMNRLSQHRTRAQYGNPGRRFVMRWTGDGFRIWRVA